jgi:hypothetical protein
VPASGVASGRTRYPPPATFIVDHFPVYPIPGFSVKEIICDVRTSRGSPRAAIYLCIHIRLRNTTLCSRGAGRAARDAYIGHIEVEQVEQQRFPGWNRHFSGDLPAQPKWSKWSASSGANPALSQRPHSSKDGGHGPRYQGPQIEPVGLMRWLGRIGVPVWCKDRTCPPALRSPGKRARPAAVLLYERQFAAKSPRPPGPEQ